MLAEVCKAETKGASDDVTSGNANTFNVSRGLQSRNKGLNSNKKQIKPQWIALSDATFKVDLFC